MQYNLSPEDIKHAQQLFADAERITLLAHTKPDPDSLGACLALALVAKRHGKSVEIIAPKGVLEPYPLPIPSLLNGAHKQKPDLLITCDTSSHERRYFHRDFVHVPSIVIDHHVDPAIEATLLFIDHTAASTCELVLSLLAAWDEPLVKDIADPLLLGIISDTQTLSTSNVTANTFACVQELVSAGANIAELKQKLITHRSPAVLLLWGELFHMMRVRKNESVIWFYCPEALLDRYHLTTSALTGFLNMVSQQMQTDLLALFYEEGGKTKVSMRSKTRNVQEIAKQFGGGGHVRASGITSDVPIEELEKKVSELF
jgi:phosphoesterase RecJ-like protein